MANERARELEERGIEAAKAGHKDEARRLLQHSLRLDANSDNAWLWLASVAKDKRERLLCLQKVLEINPENEMGLKAVQAMGIDPARLMPERASIRDSLVEDDADAEGGVPLPTRDFVESAVNRAEVLVAPYTHPPEVSKITWGRKEKGRAGERQVWILRAQIATALAVFGAFVLGLLFVAVDNSPEVQLVLFGASPTPVPPSATPTPTLTPRPDINPTVTPTPDFTAQPTFTATPTLNALATRWPLGLDNAPVYQTPTPTALHLNAGGNAIATAVVALRNERDYDDAIERMRVSQSQAGSDFEPYFYYFEALLRLQQGNTEAAFAALDLAQSRLDDTGPTAVVNRTQARNLQPVVNAGYLHVYLAEMRDALATGNLGAAASRIASMEPLHAQAVEIAPTFAEPTVLMAEGYILARRFDDAIAVTENALGGLLASNPAVIAANGRAHLERGRDLQRRGQAQAAREDFARASFIGYYGVTVNPFSDAAHQLRVEAALALGDPALASAYTNNFLFYRPDNPDAFRLLASVRAAENKPEFALDVFTQALEQPNISSVSLAQTYRERAQLYLDQRRYDLALADLNASFERVPSLETRFLRMAAAYNAGDLATALDDAEQLIEIEFEESGEARLIRARVIVDERRTAQYDIALEDLNALFNALSPELQHVVSEYQARIFLQRGDLGEALNAVNRAINAVETGSRRYLRGQIYEARGERENAIREYEWLLIWNTVFDYPFIDDVRDRLDAILTGIADEQMAATATAVFATQEVVDVTLTFEAELALSATPTPTPTPTLTPTPETDESGESA